MLFSHFNFTFTPINSIIASLNYSKYNDKKNKNKSKHQPKVAAAAKNLKVVQLCMNDSIQMQKFLILMLHFLLEQKVE